MASYVSRVMKIDAVTLDYEFQSLLKKQLVNLLDLLKVGSLMDSYGSEIELLLKFFIWKFSVYDTGSTLGQKLLGIKFDPRFKRKLVILFVLESLIPYLWEKFCRLYPNTSRIPYLRRSIKYTESIVKFFQIFNFCVFLMQNRYPTLSLRLLNLPIVPVNQYAYSLVGYSYQIRELLWHQFADFLMITLPVINIHRLKRYFNDWLGTKSQDKKSVMAPTEKSSKCCFCTHDAVMPQYVKSCTFCYYCLQSNKIADPDFNGNKNCPHFN